MEKIMQLAVNVSLPNILTLISQMSLNEIEQVKNEIVEKELYFKRFKKDKIENVMSDFQKENYSDDFLKELEDGLKKSSVYNED
jgi:threonyl-tRNA synthetase